MVKKSAFAASFLLVIVIVVLGGIVFYKNQKACSASIINNSSIINVSVVDQKKFADFISEYGKCEKGVFTLGDPFEKIPVNVSKIVFEFVDNERNYKVSEEKRGVGRFEGEYLYTYDFSVGGDEVKVYINISDNLVEREEFDKFLPYILASKTDMMVKYDDPLNILDRTIKSIEEFPYTAENIGIAFE